MSSEDPVSYLTLEEGTDVFCADSERVGVVQHVLADPELDIFDGLVIDVTMGPGGVKFVDAPYVADIRENSVHLTISSAEVETLPEPSANPTALEHHGSEDTEGGLEAKLRRAWDLISGNY